ncbi:carbohydrate ABC transporter permease [Jiangella mangrovi]|uniref:Multiple sugar transport system permease protein n=1 Tax=Jiangella mangrovi TaxID=1524084 RepID=A0A7W9GLQ3_9ACTN|nr:sugar ABC transporter permease [Jiangella mangrovi]MBB5786169.1 multiple sugar transport system permease protein [Jiangella mangrovi]
MATATTAPASRPSPVGGSPGTKRRRSLLQRRQTRTAWLLALPFLLLFAAFTVGPVFASLVMSFTDMRSTDVRTPFAVDLAGIDNYTALFQDPLFRKVALNTAIFVAVGVPLTMVLALAAAVGLNRITRLRAFFRLGFYLPVVTSIVAVAVVWRFLLQPDTGPINQLLGVVGIDGPDWLGEPSLALPSVIAMATWRNLGTLMVIFLAGLQTVPRELLEAAEVDGAGRWQRFRHVTLPLLRPVLLFGAVITGIGYLQFFEESFVMTNGGPLNATRSVAYYTYDQFSFGNYGYASAASYVLFVAIVVLTAIQFRVLRPKT